MPDYTTSHNARLYNIPQCQIIQHPTMPDYTNPTMPDYTTCHNARLYKSHNACDYTTSHYACDYIFSDIAWPQCWSHGFRWFVGHDESSTLTSEYFGMKYIGTKTKSQPSESCRTLSEKGNDTIAPCLSDNLMWSEYRWKLAFQPPTYPAIIFRKSVNTYSYPVH